MAQSNPIPYRGPRNAADATADDRSPRRRTIIAWSLVAVPVGLILFLIGVYVAISAYEAYNVGRARRHLPLVQAKTANDSRFAAVEFFPFIDMNGCLVVKGEVTSQADLAALRAILMGTSPPVNVEWCVDVVPPAAPHR